MTSEGHSKHFTTDQTTVKIAVTTDQLTSLEDVASTTRKISTPPAISDTDTEGPSSLPSDATQPHQTSASMEQTTTLASTEFSQIEQVTSSRMHELTTRTPQLTTKIPELATFTLDATQQAIYQDAAAGQEIPFVQTPSALGEQRVFKA